MTDDSRPISLKVQAEDGTASSAEAVSIGLIVTELVINAFKHAFVGDRAAGRLVVAYEAAVGGAVDGLVIEILGKRSIHLPMGSSKCQRVAINTTPAVLLNLEKKSSVSQFHVLSLVNLLAASARPLMGSSMKRPPPNQHCLECYDAHSMLRVTTLGSIYLRYDLRTFFEPAG